MRLQVVYDEHGGVVAATTLLDPEQLSADETLLQVKSASPPPGRSILLAEVTIPEHLSDLSLAELCTSDIVRGRFGGRPSSSP